jgi:hypothetical protein
MKFHLTTRDSLLKKFESCLQEGIGAETAAGYQTKTKSFTLFIEPEEHRIEILSRGHPVLTLHFEQDNRTWGDITYKGYSTQNKVFHDEVVNIYSKIKEERGLHAI